MTNFPDLESGVDAEIASEDPHAVQAICFTCLPEQLRVFQVMEQILLLFQQGVTPIGSGERAETLFHCGTTLSERMSEGERATV